MRVAWRKDLEYFLAGFVAGHRGLRLGRMFGAPAAYAGRRLVSFAVDDGIIAKLPPAALEMALTRGAKRWNRTRKPSTNWMIFRPRTARATEAIAPFLELAANYVAEHAGRA